MPEPLTMSPAELGEEVRLYRELRVARLAAPDGWLSLVAKHWLSEGTTTVGGDPACDVVVAGAPARVATVTRVGAEVRLQVEEGVEATARGGRVEAPIALRSDAEAQPDRVQIGSLRLELIRRGDDLALRVRDPENPVRRGFAGIPCYEVDPALRVVGRFHADAAPVRVDVGASDGRPQTEVSPGSVTFEVNGVACRLRLFDESVGRRLFVMFGDPTNRDETYGGGRFLYTALPADGYVVLDFNKAFNPPCAFTPFASCPLPPAENRLSVAVRAGEKRPAL